MYLLERRLDKSFISFADHFSRPAVQSACCQFNDASNAVRANWFSPARVYTSPASSWFPASLRYSPNAMDIA